MFKNILVVTDTSFYSMGIVHCLGQLKAAGVEKCFLVQCVEAKEILYGVSADKSLFESAMEEQKQVLEKQGFQASVSVIIGNINAEIKKAVKTNDSSFIVVGMLKHSLASELFFSSITDAVIKSAVIPVLIIPFKKEKKSGAVSIQCRESDIKRHVLFPTDFSQNADLAFSFLQKFVGTGVEKVTLFHVQDRAKIGSDFESRIEEFNRIDSARLENFKNMLEGAKETEIKIACGVPVHEIMKFVEEEGVSQIIMGTQGRSYIKELFLGSVSHKIARTSNLPVFLVPMKKG